MGLINFPQLEERVLSRWKERGVFQRTLEKDAPRGNFVFFEGPPTANGKPGIHHVLARAFKDLIPRFKTMQGFRVERKAGWDTHGLPVELQVERKLGISGKPQIETLKATPAESIAYFNQQCLESVWQYKEEWERLTERMAFWLDLAHPYVTYESSYIESLWQIIKQFWLTRVDANGQLSVGSEQSAQSVEHRAGWQRLLYQGHKVVPHCPRCGTALSSHEVAQGYKEVEEKSVYVKLKITPLRPASDGATEGEKNEKFKNDRTFFLAWTTTPWTLPGNVALAVGSNISYSRVRFADGDYIVATDRIGAVLGDATQTALAVQEMKGKDLLGLEYEPLFPGAIATTPSAPQKGDAATPPAAGGESPQSLGIQADGGKSPLASPLEKGGVGGGKAFKVYAADFVSTEEGTGIVHTAVMYGEDDYELGLKVGLPQVHTVDEEGKFNERVPQWQGKFVKDPEVEQGIVTDLQERGLLLKEELYKHDYPFCWRCGTPLLYYAKPSWFVRMSALRNQLQAANQTINWVPSYIKEGRFGEWLSGAKDWAFSRERYWGTPLPIWQCPQGHQVCVGSLAELERLSVNPLPAELRENLHRPYIDRVILRCERCAEPPSPPARGVVDGEMHRVEEVADVWFDSGAMPFAQWGWPHEPGSEQQLASHYPADYISEAIDQTRGWFYTLLAVATALGREAPYRNVICLGHINDKEGKKMSKSKGNIVDPWEVFAKYGADATRFYLYTLNQPGEPKDFDPAGVNEVVKKTFLPLWNVLTFYKLYSVEGNDEQTIEDLALTTVLTPRHVLDRWLLARLRRLVVEITKGLEAYDVFTSGRMISDFILEDLSKWYVRRSRERFKSGDEDARQAAATLRRVLVQLSKVLAPFTPFLADELYQEVSGAYDSVHLSRWPEVNEESIDNQLISQMELVRQIVAQGLAARVAADVRVRQPLAKATVSGVSGLGEELQRIIADELNVKQVEIRAAGGNVSVELDTTLTEELKREGLVREFTRQVNDLRKRSGLTIQDKVNLHVAGSSQLQQALRQFEAQVLAATIAVSLSFERVETVMAADLEIDGEQAWVGLIKS